MDAAGSILCYYRIMLVLSMAALEYTDNIEYSSIKRLLNILPIVKIVCLDSSATNMQG